MGSGKKHKRNLIEPGSLPRSPIPIPHVPLPTCIVFSFKYMDLGGNPKFHLGHAGDNYLGKLLERLKAVCAFQLQEFLSNRSESLRCHPIDFTTTSEPDGFPLNEQLRQSPPHQFAISANEHGRVHGFLVGNTFYVVWLDPAHKLYE